jgi:recombinational DNA repair ATPase RecF
MINLTHIHIEEFRGIREIDLPFEDKSFVIHGPNGSGKSGVVDAIDFVSVSKHGPHVHRRDDPASAKV